MKHKVAILSADDHPQFLGGVKRVCSMLGECWMEEHGMEVEFLTFTTSELRKPMIGNIPQCFFPDGSRHDAPANRDFLVRKINGEGFTILLNPHVEEPAVNALVAMVRPRLKARVVSALHFSPTHNHDVVRESFFVRYALGSNPLSWVRQCLLWGKYRLYGLKAVGKAEMDRHLQVLENSDCFVLLSERFKESFPAAVRSRLRSINNPSPCVPADDAAPSEETDGKCNEVVWCGRLDITGAKRFDRMLRVWKRVNRMRPDWMLRVPGSGDTEHIRSLVARHGIRNVSIEGFCDPWKFYGRAKILCCTSTVEGWGMVLVEAMSRGCVPMAFDSYASVRDIIDDGVTGVLVKPFSIAGYARQLVELMDDEERRCRMAAKGRESVGRYAVTLIAAKWIELFDSIWSAR